MSLIKQSMTDENLAAHRANGRQSRGAATPEGKERSRAAHLRHGFYSQGREEALAALGEDPAALAALIEDTHEEWQPANNFQARVAERMARLWWRMERAERVQESLVVQQLVANQQRRQDAARKVRQKGVPAIDILGLLVEGTADPRFYTPRRFFRDFSEAFGDELEGEQKEILLLMHRLRKPRTRRTSPPPPPAPASEPDEDSYLDDLAAADQDDFPLPWPKTPVAEGAERDDLREELLRLAQEALGSVQRRLEPQFEEHERPWSRIEQDEAQAEPHPHAELMRREEGSCFRQFMRLGAFLLKLQKRAEKCTENEGSSGYVDENTEIEETATTTTSPRSEVEMAESEVEKAESEVRSPRSEAGVDASEVETAESDAERALYEVETEGPPEVDQAAA
jgi:hypothetical protein